MCFTIVCRGCAEKAIERFLEQVVGQLRVAANTGEVGPDTARSALVESAEGILVHHKTSARVVKGTGAADIGKCRVTKHKRRTSSFPGPGSLSTARRAGPSPRRRQFNQSKPLGDQKGDYRRNHEPQAKRDAENAQSMERP